MLGLDTRFGVKHGLLFGVAFVLRVADVLNTVLIVWLIPVLLACLCLRASDRCWRDLRPLVVETVCSLIMLGSSKKAASAKNYGFCAFRFLCMVISTGGLVSLKMDCWVEGRFLAVIMLYFRAVACAK